MQDNSNTYEKTSKKEIDPQLLSLVLDNVLGIDEEEKEEEPGEWAEDKTVDAEDKDDFKCEEESAVFNKIPKELSDKEISAFLKANPSITPEKLKKINENMPNFRLAMKNVTLGEISFYRQGLDIMYTKLVEAKAEKEELGSNRFLYQSPQVIRCVVASMRWCNMICNFCGNYEKPNFCTRCYLVQYCSKKCQAAEWPVHKDICGKPDSIKRELGRQKGMFGNKNVSTGQVKPGFN